MPAPKPDFEALSRKYAELGFDLPASEIEKFAARLQITAAGIEAVRSIDASAFEPATHLTLRRYEEAGSDG